LLLDPAALSAAIDSIADFARERRVDVVAAAEARGFILGGAVARTIGAGFIPVRKPGKLPWDTHSAEYVLEYGVDALEIHKDAVSDGARVLVHDDLLATGGTAAAVCDLIRRAGGEVVGCSFLAELAFLDGRAKLPGCDVQSLVVYDSE
jgi:adenine phosphoribosyltransferase